MFQILHPRVLRLSGFGLCVGQGNGPMEPCFLSGASHDPMGFHTTPRSPLLREAKRTPKGKKVRLMIFGKFARLPTWLIPGEAARTFLNTTAACGVSSVFLAAAKEQTEHPEEARQSRQAERPCLVSEEGRVGRAGEEEAQTRARADVPMASHVRPTKAKGQKPIGSWATTKEPSAELGASSPQPLSPLC